MPQDVSSAWAAFSAFRQGGDRPDIMGQESAVGRRELLLKVHQIGSNFILDNRLCRCEIVSALGGFDGRQDHGTAVIKH
jgi:hypothetical protein